MHGRRIESGEPHVANDDDLQLVIRVLRPELEVTPFILGMDVWLELGGVSSRACHHDLDTALVNVIGMPFGAQGCDLVVEGDGDAPAHRHDHCLAGHGGAALLPVGDDVGGNRIQPRFGTDESLEARPLALGLLRLCLARLSGLVHQCVQIFELFVIKGDFCQAGLVEDLDGGSVLDCAGEVVDVDVVAEDSAGGAVIGLDRGAGEAEEGGSR